MNETYLICTGSSLTRTVIGVNDKLCFWLFREEQSHYGMWFDGVSVEEGKQLVEAFKGSKNSAFGRLKNKLVEEHVTDGWSESGIYTPNRLSETLKEYDSALSEHVETILKKVYENKSELIILGKE